MGQVSLQGIGNPPCRFGVPASGLLSDFLEPSAPPIPALKLHQQALAVTDVIGPGCYPCRRIVTQVSGLSCHPCIRFVPLPAPTHVAFSDHPLWWLREGGRKTRGKC